MPALGLWRYKYRAEVVRVVDGDTVVLRVDCGFATYVVRTCRLHSIDAPEVRGENAAAGRAATGYLKQIVEDRGPFTIETIKDRTGKYGRYLIRLYDRDGIEINERMVVDGHAVRKVY